MLSSPSCKQIVPFKNLPLSFAFAESTVLRFKVNCKTFFVVILNGVCLLVLNIRGKTIAATLNTASKTTPRKVIIV